MTEHHAVSRTPRTRTSARVRRLGAIVLASSILLLGCGPESANRAPEARDAETTSQSFGNFEMHYNAVRTDELTPEVARAYGIERSGNRVLLNVSLLAKDADGRTTPIDGEVKAAARNLNGQLKDLQMRRVQEGSSIYFIGEVGISGNEILVFDIDATPGPGGERHSVQFKREFYAD
jgi:hypothetical protein